MAEDTFLCHCEATEGGRGNLKRTDLSVATGPEAGIQIVLIPIFFVLDACYPFSRAQVSQA